MAKIRRIDFSPDEWIAGTRELTLDERGAYWDVCALMYSRGGPIADDETWISKALTCHVRTWRAIRSRLIAKGKLSSVGGNLCNGRTAREIEKAESRLRNSREAADSSARERRLRAEERSTDRPEIPEDDQQINDCNGIDKAGASAADRAITNHQPSTTNHQDSIVDSAAPKRATRKAKLSADWTPTLEQLTYAKAQGCQDPADTAERFRLHHLSKGTLGADWNLGFQYWCRNESRFRPKVETRPRTKEPMQI